MRSHGTEQLPLSVRPVLYVSASRMRPVSRSTIGAGLPCVSPLPSLTTWSGPQVRPPSVDRLRTRSMSAASPQLSTRPSANASSVPSLDFTIAGMRKQAYPGSWSALKRTCCSNGDVLVLGWDSAGPNVAAVAVRATAATRTALRRARTLDGMVRPALHRLALVQASEHSDIPRPKCASQTLVGLSRPSQEPCTCHVTDGVLLSLG